MHRASLVVNHVTLQRELEDAALGGSGADEPWHLRKDGTPFFAGGVVTPIHSPEGVLIGFSKILHDITTQKEVERKIALTDQRLSKLAHRWISRPAPFASSIAETAARMSEMLEGLLQYAEAKAGREIESQSVHVDSVLQAVRLNLGSLIEETGAEITSEELPVVSGDPVRLIQLFENVIGNAIKY